MVKQFAGFLALQDRLLMVYGRQCKTSTSVMEAYTLQAQAIDL
jgi:hypothetical protein